MLKIYVDRDRAAANKAAYRAKTGGSYAPPFRVRGPTGTVHAESIEVLDDDGNVLVRFVSDPSAGGCGTVWVEVYDSAKKVVMR